MKTRTEQYRGAERSFWEHYGLEPTERFVDVGSPPVRLRVQEVGSGRPVLFVHGTGGPGAYFAPLLHEMDGLRCLVIDRPGWGLSSPISFAGRDYEDVVAELLAGTLDALGIDRAHVVGASIGNLWALRFAMAHPSRVDRVALLGGAPLTTEIKVPPFIKLLRSPVGRIIVNVPEKPGMLRKQLAGMGHGASLEGGRIPDAFVDWHVAMSRLTDWGRHEREMVRAIVDRHGFASGLVLEPEEISRIEQPTLMVCGTADPVGSVGIWTRFIDRMPRGELELVDGGGHLPWYDDPARVGARVTAFLTADR